MKRREFLGAMAGLTMQTQSLRQIEIKLSEKESFLRRLARLELLRGLVRLGLGTEERPGKGKLTFALRVETDKFRDAESYSISTRGDAVVFSAASARALRTSRFTMGASELCAGEVFGSDATRLARNPWEAAERTQRTLRTASACAAKLGIRTGIGFEPYQIPDEILRALPPEAKPAPRPEGRGRRPRGPAAWTRTPARHVARKTYEAMLGPFASEPNLTEYEVSAGDLTSPAYLITIA